MFTLADAAPPRDPLSTLYDDLTAFLPSFCANLNCLRPFCKLHGPAPLSSRLRRISQVQLFARTRATRAGRGVIRMRARTMSILWYVHVGRFVYCMDAYLFSFLEISGQLSLD